MNKEYSATLRDNIVMSLIIIWMEKENQNKLCRSNNSIRNS